MNFWAFLFFRGSIASQGLYNKQHIQRRVLRRGSLQKVLRTVLRRHLAVGFSGGKASEKGS